MASPVILAYHAVEDQPANVAVSPREFLRQMHWLKDHGYEAATVSALLSQGAGPKTVALTFDDGFRSTHSTVLPILNELGYRATCFPITEGLGRSTSWRVAGARLPTFQLMSISEVSELVAEGWEIGSHTTRHRCCVRRDTDDLRTDLSRARDHLQDRLGVPVSGFAYPQGCHDGSAMRVVAEVGHAWAVTTSPGAVRNSPGPYSLRRVTIGNSTTFLRFLAAGVGPVQAVRRVYCAQSGRGHRPHTHPADVHTTDFI